MTKAEQAANQFLKDCGADVVQVHAFPRNEHIGRLAGRYRTVVTVHVPMCPNGARYLWKPRCVCNRDVGIGCFTRGYLQDGCGKLGNGVPMSVQAFARAMYDDGRLRRALRHCAELVAPSRWRADRLIADGFEPRKMHVVPPPMAAEAEAESAAFTAGRAFCGTAGGDEGRRDLVMASGQVKTPHEVWIAGDGPERGVLEKLVWGIECGGTGEVSWAADAGGALGAASGGGGCGGSVAMAGNIWDDGA